jgi:hypothetical protein
VAKAMARSIAAMSALGSSRLTVSMSPAAIESTTDLAVVARAGALAGAGDFVAGGDVPLGGAVAAGRAGARRADVRVRSAGGRADGRGSADRTVRVRGTTIRKV